MQYFCLEYSADFDRFPVMISQILTAVTCPTVSSRRWQFIPESLVFSARDWHIHVDIPSQCFCQFTVRRKHDQ